jgi:hypothetical protein
MLEQLNRLTQVSRNVLAQVRLCAAILPLDYDHPDHDLQEMALEKLWRKRIKLFRELRRRMDEIDWRGWPQKIARLSPEERRAAEDLLEETRETLNEAGELDERTKVIMEDLYQQTAQDMQSMGRGQKLIRAYMPGACSRCSLPAQLSRTG